jgi:hypothetical protein
MKYRVVIACDVVMTAADEVEASSIEEAMRIAVRRDQEGDWPEMKIEWESASDDRIATVFDESGNFVEFTPELEEAVWNPPAT